MVKMATAEANAVHDAIQSGAAPPPPPVSAPSAAGGLGDQLSYCASLARNYAVARLLGHTADANRYQALLTAKDGDCDPDGPKPPSNTGVLLSKGKDTRTGSTRT